jgi:hypothetical protein
MNADIKRRKKRKEKKGRREGKERKPPEVAGAAAAADASDWERNRNATECGPPVLYISTHRWIHPSDQSE